jgi:hypothetical protein
LAVDEYTQKMQSRNDHSTGKTIIDALSGIVQYQSWCIKPSEKSLILIWVGGA